jgi:hypothetical protein
VPALTTLTRLSVSWPARSPPGGVLTGPERGGRSQFKSISSTPANISTCSPVALGAKIISPTRHADFLWRWNSASAPTSPETRAQPWLRPRPTPTKCRFSPALCKRDDWHHRSRGTVAALTRPPILSPVQHSANSCPERRFTLQEVRDRESKRQSASKYSSRLIGEAAPRGYGVEQTQHLVQLLERSDAGRSNLAGRPR